MPKNLFYGTNIGTYIWVLSNRKPVERLGKIQLINAVSEAFYTPLRRSLGKKMVEISASQIAKITELYTNNTDVATLSKIFANEDFGYTKVTVERPLRLRYQIIDEQVAALKDLKAFVNLATSKKKDAAKALLEIEAGKQRQAEILAAITDIQASAKVLSDLEFIQAVSGKLSFKLAKAWIKILRNVFGIKDEAAPKVLLEPLAKKIPAIEKMDVVPAKWYEINTGLRDTESIPLKQDIEDYFEREVLPYAADAWMDREKDRVGYTIGFTKYFYEYKPLRDLEIIMAEFKGLDVETEDLIKHIED